MYEKFFLDGIKVSPTFNFTSQEEKSKKQSQPNKQKYKEKYV